MKRETSVYLDLMRCCAAVAVFLDHIKGEHLTQGFLKPLGIYGEEGVAVFFVISGMVVSHVVTNKERHAASYAVARLSRLWSVVVPAIALTVILDCVGARIDPSLYTTAGLPPPWRFDLASLWRAVAPILFLNQSLSPGTNGPFWSLCYEFWYYAAFGVAIFCRGWVRVVGLCLAAVIAGPHILLMSPLWVLGVAVYRLRGRLLPSPWLWAGWIGSGLAVVAIAVLKYRIGAIAAPILPGKSLPGPQLIDIIAYSVAIPFALNVLFFDAIAAGFSRLLAAGAPAVRALAGRSFSLYLYQAPLLFFFAAVTRNASSRPLRIAVVCGATLALVAVLAEFTERQRPRLAKAMHRLLMARQEGDLAGAGNVVLATPQRS